MKHDTPRRSRRGLVTAIAAATVLAGATTAAAYTAPAPGAPARPPASPPVDRSLPDHKLAYAPGPLDNPDKGLAVYYQAGADQNTGYPHSLTWSYFGLSEVMTDPADCTKLDWSVVDKMLAETAANGNTAAIRFYLEYPGDPGGGHPGNAIPACFAGKVANRTDAYWNTTSPDYDNQFLLDSLRTFIAAYGARYDGDPRLGFVQMGLVGLWGEWHTWPYNGSGGYPDLMPTDAHAALIVNAYANAFHKTPLEVRYPYSAGGAATDLPVGYHDDSFCYRDQTTTGGVSLPQSLGGESWSQLQLALNQGTENKWINTSIGGEVRPEIQTTAFQTWSTGAAGNADDMKACIELEHPTWELDQASTGYDPADPDVAAAVRAMGYDLSVTDAYFHDQIGRFLNVGVTVTNDGVAPFYQPWTVRLALKDAGGNVVKTWDTPWDLRTVMPARIRTFPDWNTGAAYLPYGSPQNFQTEVDTAGLAHGRYQLVMGVANPLSAAGANANAKTLRFANATQNADGWLGLGSVTVR